RRPAVHHRRGPRRARDRRAEARPARARAQARGLERALAGRDRGEGQREDAEVAAEREVLDVVALDGEALLEVELAASEDLHRPRDPRLHREPEAMLGRVATA